LISHGFAIRYAGPPTAEAVDGSQVVLSSVTAVLRALDDASVLLNWRVVGMGIPRQFVTPASDW
jgi:hypothetical protein